MKLPVRVRVSHKRIAFSVFHRLVSPTGNMGGQKRVRSGKTDMPDFLLKVFWTFILHQFPCRWGGRKSGGVANRQLSPGADTGFLPGVGAQ